MNLIRWIASTVLSAMLLPQVLGTGGAGDSTPLPPELEQQLRELASQAEASGAPTELAGSSFLVLGTDEVLSALQDGLDGLEPIVEVVQQVKSATAAAGGPAVLPPGVRLARVTLQLAVPVGEAADDD